jgi:hypothetical protein
MRIANILKRTILNTEEINKTLDKMSLFINDNIGEINEQDEYIIVIDKHIKGIMYYDKLTNNLYYDKNTIGKDLTNEFVNGSSIKNTAIQKFFIEKYPDFEVKKVLKTKLTVI